MADSKDKPYDPVDPHDSVSAGSSLDKDEDVQSHLITSRTSFSALSQVDADLALARTLQEQERAYMMLGYNNSVEEYGVWETGSFVEEEYFDEFDGVLHSEGGNDYEYIDEDNSEDDEDDEDEEDNDVEDILSAGIDLSELSGGDESYARSLQHAEDVEMAARMFTLARLNNREVDSVDLGGSSILDTWEDVDPDELSYEELIALGEVVGNESRGLSADKISSLPTIVFKAQSPSCGDANDFCVICRMEYEDGESLSVLSCNHSYHAPCLQNWLQIKKVCPVCNSEVCISSSS